MNILLVDDEDIIHRTLGVFLSRSGHSVRRAQDGKEALLALGSEIPDLVISDIKMPTMDGLELVDKLKLRAPTTPIVLITGHGDEGTASAALHKGAYYYLRKPVSLEKLLSLVERIEERKQLVQSLMLEQTKRSRSQRQFTLDTLAAGIAHEINNPMTVICGNLQSLQEILEPLIENSGSAWAERADELPNLLDGILTGTEHIEHIIQQIQMFARTQIKKMPGPVDLAACLERSLEQVEVERAGILLEKRFGQQIIEGIDRELTQIFVCLLQNAVQAIDGRSGGRILVEVFSHEAGWTTVMITDNGVGIADENADRVFDPFFTTRDPGKGTGLGLAICQSIVAAHGGDIGFNSRSGNGCQFWIRFPYEREGEFASQQSQFQRYTSEIV
jgi:two-component system, NtrC family, sensor kinase